MYFAEPGRRNEISRQGVLVSLGLFLRSNQVIHLKYRQCQFLCHAKMVALF